MRRDPGADGVHAEEVDLVDRLIVAPVAGAFFPDFTEVTSECPGVVAIGDEVGVVVQTGEKHPVTSPFTGRLMQLLALPGERVRQYQPVAWIVAADDDAG